jgi:hypothetical protein
VPAREFDASFDPGFDPAADVPSRQYTPAWLAQEDVRAWLRLNDQDDGDGDLITRVCAMTEPYVQRCRPEWFQLVEPSGAVEYMPDAETYQGAVMHAAREYRRRNSPAGVEAFGDAGTSFVSRYDPDIEKALQTGAYARPVIA